MPATTLMKEPNRYIMTTKDCRTLASEILLLATVGIILQQDVQVVIDDSAKIIQLFLESQNINVSN